MKYSLRKISSLVLFLLVLMAVALAPSSSPCLADAKKDDDKPALSQYMKQLREKYDNLPDQGKFVTGVVVGFGGSKLVTRSAVTVVKIAGAAFVATEIMQAMGVLDQLVTEEQKATGMNMQQRALGYVSEFRQSIKSKFESDNIKAWLDSDKAVTLGAAAGAVAGFLF